MWRKLEAYLKQGQDPKTLSVTITLGMLLGLFPIVGTTTLLCFLVSIPLRLNIVVIQLANYLVYPLQLLLLVPIIKLGGVVFGAPQIPNLEQFLNQGPGALKTVWVYCLYGVAVWFVLSVPVFFVLYFLLLRLFRKKVATEY